MRQQFLAATVAFATALAVVVLSWHGYFARDLVPPVARVYVATIGSGVAPGVAPALILWAVPGALLQWVGGSRRQLGVLLSTGLLIGNPAAGWGVMAGLAVRLGWERLLGRPAGQLDAVAAGFIAGDALWSFGDSVVKQVRAVSDDMAAVLSLDTTKGNRVLNVRGFAISPTVKEGWILEVAPDLVRLAETSSGKPAVTFPITMQDITPYGNGVDHLNSILQPATATRAPVVGVALAAETAVPGCATGASHEVDIAEAVRFVIEVAKEVGAGTCRFYDEREFARLVALYGDMRRLQGGGAT